ncbi:MAG: T9SS type A sorting domain-containing protein [Chitinophagales bacterium]
MSNPTKDVLHMQYTQNFEANNIEIKIFDILGQEVLTQDSEAKIGTNNLQINISQLAKGYYLVQTSNGLEQRTQKFIIQ